MKIGDISLRKLTGALALGTLLMTGVSFAQEAPAPEAAKVEAPAAAAAPAAEAAPKKEDPAAAPAQFTQGLLEQIGGAKVAMDTMWVLITGMLVFFMNLGFACVESGLCRAKNAVTILSKNFIVFAVDVDRFLAARLGADVWRWQRYVGTEGLWMVSGADNSPAMGDAYRASTRLQLDRRAAVGQVLLPARVRAEPRRRSSPARWPSASNSSPSSSSPSSWRIDLSGRRPLDLGRRLARQVRLLRLRRLDRGALRRRLGGFDRGDDPSGRASASLIATVNRCRSPAIASPWRPLGCSCFGSVGSASIPAAPWPRMPAPSVGSPSRLTRRLLLRRFQLRSRHGSSWASRI